MALCEEGSNTLPGTGDDRSKFTVVEKIYDYNYQATKESIARYGKEAKCGRIAASVKTCSFI